MVDTREGETPATASILEGAAAERSRRFARHVDVATHLLHSGAHGRARHELEAALQIDPHHPRVRAVLAMVLFRMRDYVGAGEVYERLQAEFPGDVPLNFNLGVSYLAAGRTAHATRSFHEVLKVRPDHHRARRLAAVAERGGPDAPPVRDSLPLVGPAAARDVRSPARGVLLLRVMPGSGWRVRAGALGGTVGAVETFDDRVFGLGRAIVRGQAQARGMSVEGDAAWVRASRLLAYGDGLTAEEALPAVDEAMACLRGHGSYVVDADGQVARVRVTPGEGARLRADWLLGWEGTIEVAPVATTEGPPLVHVAGDGTVLVEMGATLGGSMSGVKDVSGWGRFEIVQQLVLTEADELLLARVLGPGGFQRTVVLKRHFTRCEDGSPYLQRLAREALAYALLSHPAIVRLYDFLLLDGQPVFVFECVHGVSLARLMRTLRGPLPDAVALYIGHAVFSALAAAHQARNAETGEFAPVIHRDVHPANVLLAWTGEVKLANFAMAKVAGGPVSLETTQPGTLRGTFGYMAPEQVLGDLSTVRTDVYSASLLLWELLARRRAFDAGRMPELECLQAMASPQLPSIASLRPDLPKRLAEALAVGMSPNADDRHIAAADFARILEESVDLRAAREACVALLPAMGRGGQTKGPASVARRAAQQADTDESAAFGSQPSSMGRLTPPSGVSVPPPPATTPWLLPSDAPVAHSHRPHVGARSTVLPWVAAAAVLVAVLGGGGTATWMVTRGHASAAAGPPTVAVATTATANVAQPRANVAQPGANVVQPAANIAQPGANIAQPGANVAPPGASVVQPGASVVQLGANVASQGSSAGLAPAASVPSAGVPANGSPTTGTLVTGPAADHHRIFVDGHVVGEGEGSFVVRCGPHVVRVGSAGQDHPVTVPCDGVLDLR